MPGLNGQVWFITGASTGFGKSLAIEVLKRGGRVVATARNPDQIDPAITGSDRAVTARLDVTDASQCAAAVEQSLAAFGCIDVLVNNAGFGMVGAVEEVSDAEVRKVYDTNVFGLLNVLRAGLPPMRAAKSGHVINIGSVGGLLARAGSGIYCSTKFAVEGISEGLYHELSPLGIGVTVVEPGPFRTDFGGRSLHEAGAQFDDYAETAGAWRLQLQANSGKQQGDPDKAAAVIIDAVISADPPLHLVLGPPAMERATEKLQALLGEIENWRDVSMATDFD